MALPHPLLPLPPPPSPSLSSSTIYSSSSHSTTSAKTSASTATTAVETASTMDPIHEHVGHDRGSHNHQDPHWEHHPAVVYGGVAFPAGNDDFRAARNYCARACRNFNNTPEDAPPEVRSSRWLDIIRPARDRSTDPLSATAITHDMTFRNPFLKSQTPFVKPPFYVDYGLRIRIGASTFINRGCMIMDTPVADVVLGERCNVGPNCCIVSVGHALTVQERLGKQDSIGKPITVGDGVWIGANVTILGGVTIGDGVVIGAGSVITRNIPPATLAVGVPARVIQSLDSDDMKMRASEVCGSVATLTEAMAFARSTPMDRLEALELARLSSGAYQSLPKVPPSGYSPPAKTTNDSAKYSAVSPSPSSSSSAASGRKPGSQSCSESTMLDDDDDENSDNERCLRHGGGGGPTRARRRRRDRSRTSSSRTGGATGVMRNCPRLFKSEIMAVVVVTSIAFTLLTCLFFVGVLMGAKWFAVLVNSPSTMM